MIRRFFTRILIVLLITACGYNAWQVHRLQGQVQALSLAVRAGHLVMEHHTAVTDAAPPVSWLTRANDHAARAGTALSRAHVAEAQRDLALSAEDVRRATREMGLADAPAKLAQLRERLRSLHAQAQSVQTKAGPEIKAFAAQAARLQAQAQNLWRESQS